MVVVIIKSQHTKSNILPYGNGVSPVLTGACWKSQASLENILLRLLVTCHNSLIKAN